MPKAYIGGYLFLRGLTSAEGLKLPENFDIRKLIAPNHVIEEIKNHPEKYYVKKEEDISKVKEQVLNAEPFADEQEVEVETLNDDVEEAIEYKGKHFK